MTHNASPAVLVVDDEPDLADLYATWLASDYTVTTAYNGEEALQLLDETVDVILLDRLMPGISGDEVLEEVRERGLDCRVAMVTAVEPDFDVLELGFDEYLTKPATQEELREVVETLLARKRHHTTIQEYYRLISKRSLLECELGPDATTDPRYDALQAEITSLKADLDDITAGLSDDDFVAQLHRLGRGRYTDDETDAMEGAQ